MSTSSVYTNTCYDGIEAIYDMSGEYSNDMSNDEIISRINTLLVDNVVNRVGQIRNKTALASWLLQNVTNEKTCKNNVLTILTNLTTDGDEVSRFLYEGPHNNNYKILFNYLNDEDDDIVFSASWLFQHLVSDVQNYDFTYEVVESLVERCVYNQPDNKVMMQTTSFFYSLVSSSVIWREELLNYPLFWKFVSNYLSLEFDSTNLMYAMKYIFKSDFSEFEDTYHFIPLLMNMYFLKTNVQEKCLIYDIIDTFLSSDDPNWTDYIISSGFLCIIRHSLGSHNMKLIERATFSVSNMTINSVDTAFTLADSHVYDMMFNDEFISRVVNDKKAHMNFLVTVGNLLQHDEHEISNFLVKHNINKSLMETLFGDRKYTLPIFAKTAGVLSDLMQKEPYDVSFTNEQKTDIRNVINHFNSFSSHLDEFV